MISGADPWHWTWWGIWYPWAEANTGLLSVVQGILSVAALGTAILFFLHEQKRANQAEAKAQQLERNAALARQEEIERLAVEKISWEFQAHQERVGAYARTVSGIIQKLEEALEEELVALKKIETSEAMAMSHCTLRNRAMAGSVRDCLLALLPSGPQDPEMIIATQEAAQEAGRIYDYPGPDNHISVRSFLTRILTDLRKARSDLNARTVILQIAGPPRFRVESGS
jgi:hypothetical protein